MPFVSNAIGELEGPYVAEDYGRDAYGHPVNQQGRCSAMNPPPGGTGTGCPSRLDMLSYLTALTLDDVVLIAAGLGITIPPLPVKNVLIQLILTAQGY